MFADPELAYCNLCWSNVGRKGGDHSSFIPDRVVYCSFKFMSKCKILENGYHATRLLYAGLVKGALPLLISQPTLQLLDKFHRFHCDEEWFGVAVKLRFDIYERFDSDGVSPIYCINLKN